MSESEDMDFVFEEHSGSDGDDAASDEVELDDFQAREIRQIFLTTLPEYLDPVSQMMEQVLAKTEGYESILKALQSTLSSIATAATRVGITDVVETVDLMRERLLMLEDGDAPESETRRTLSKALKSLQVLAGVGDRAEGAGATTTIVAAMKNVEGIDGSVLEKLTAAGLVTLAQLKMANPQEIVAVSGLSRELVDRMLSTLLGAESDVALPAESLPLTDPLADPQANVGEPLQEATLPHRPAPKAPRKPSRPTPKPSPSPPSAAPPALQRQLEAQATAEASLDELRAAILSSRLQIEVLQKQSTLLERRKAELRTDAAKVRGEITETLRATVHARARRRTLELERVSVREALESARDRLNQLRRQCQASLKQRDQLAQEVADVRATVARIRTTLNLAPGSLSSGEQDS